MAVAVLACCVWLRHFWKQKMIRRRARKMPAAPPTAAALNMRTPEFDDCVSEKRIQKQTEQMFALVV